MSFSMRVLFLIVGFSATKSTGEVTSTTSTSSTTSSPEFNVRCWGGLAARSREGTEILAPTDTFGRVPAMHAGPRHQCLVLESGSVQCWPAGLETDQGFPPVVDVKVQGSQNPSACAITETRTVSCWGDTPPDVPAGLSNVMSLAVGSDDQGKHVCVAHADGTVTCFGAATEHGVLEVPTSLANVVQVDAGGQSTCALHQDGSITCWGMITSLGSFESSWGIATSVSVGVRHACAVLQDQQVKCWGDNSLGQMDVPDGLRSTWLSAGTDYTCSIQDGSLVPVCWGDSSRFGGSAAPPYWVQQETWMLSVGDSHVCALSAGTLAPPVPYLADEITCDPVTSRGSFSGTTTGKTNVLGNDAADHLVLFCPNVTGLYTIDTCATIWDTHLRVYDDFYTNQGPGRLQNDDYCRCGDETQSRISAYFEAGYCHYIVVEGHNDEDGDFTLSVQCPANYTSPGVVCWGDEETFSSEPRSLPPVSKLHATQWHQCAVLESGLGQCWGRFAHLLPVPSDLGPIITIKMWGEYYDELGACAITEAFALVCWGVNWNPDLSWVPSQVVDFDVTHQSQGFKVCVLDAQGAMSCDHNDFDWSQVQNVKQVASRGDSRCALTEADTVTCHLVNSGPWWGFPQGSMRSIHMAAEGFCAIMEAGHVECTDGISVPSALQTPGIQVTDLIAGSYFFCARVEGQQDLTCFGDDAQYIACPSTPCVSPWISAFSVVTAGPRNVCVYGEFAAAASSFDEPDVPLDQCGQTVSGSAGGYRNIQGSSFKPDLALRACAPATGRIIVDTCQTGGNLYVPIGPTGSPGVVVETCGSNNTGFRIDVEVAAGDCLSGILEVEQPSPDFLYEVTMNCVGTTKTTSSQTTSTATTLTTTISTFTTSTETSLAPTTTVTDTTLTTTTSSTDTTTTATTTTRTTLTTATSITSTSTVSTSTVSTSTATTASRTMATETSSLTTTTVSDTTLTTTTSSTAAMKPATTVTATTRSTTTTISTTITPATTVTATTRSTTTTISTTITATTETTTPATTSTLAVLDLTDIMDAADQAEESLLQDLLNNGGDSARTEVPGGIVVASKLTEQANSGQSATLVLENSVVRVDVPAVVLSSLVPEGEEVVLVVTEITVPIANTRDPNPVSVQGAVRIDFVASRGNQTRTLSVDGLSEEMEITLPVPFKPGGLRCAFFDEVLQEWSSSGLRISPRSVESQPTVCLTSHLSLFGALPFEVDPIDPCTEVAGVLGIIVFWSTIGFYVYLFLVGVCTDMQRTKTTWPAQYLVLPATPDQQSDAGGVSCCWALCRALGGGFAQVIAREKASLVAGLGYCGGPKTVTTRLVMTFARRAVGASLRLGDDLVNLVLEDQELRDMLITRKDRIEDLPPAAFEEALSREHELAAGWSFAKNQEDCWVGLHASLCKAVSTVVEAQLPYKDPTDDSDKVVSERTLVGYGSRVFLAQSPLGMHMIWDMNMSRKMKSFLLLVRITCTLLLTAVFLQAYGLIDTAGDCNEGNVILGLPLALAAYVLSHIFSFILKSFRARAFITVETKGCPASRLQQWAWAMQDGIVLCVGFAVMGMGMAGVRLLLVEAGGNGHMGFSMGAALVVGLDFLLLPLLTAYLPSLLSCLCLRATDIERMSDDFERDMPVRPNRSVVALVAAFEEPPAQEEPLPHPVQVSVRDTSRAARPPPMRSKWGQMFACQDPSALEEDQPLQRDDVSIRWL